MRLYPSSVLEALAGRKIGLILLIEMYLTGNLFLNTSSLDIPIGNDVYYGTKGLGSIGAIESSSTEIKALSFQLSGVPLANIALALSEPVRGKDILVKLAFVDAGLSGAILFVQQLWGGYLDVMSYSKQDNKATISVSAEHVGIDLIRPFTSLYCDSEQQRLHPGDLSMQYLIDQSDQRIVWPSAQWGKQ